jgi:hypothetical protein
MMNEEQQQNPVSIEEQQQQSVESCGATATTTTTSIVASTMQSNEEHQHHSNAEDIVTSPSSASRCSKSKSVRYYEERDWDESSEEEFVVHSDGSEATDDMSLDSVSNQCKYFLNYYFILHLLDVLFCVQYSESAVAFQIFLLFSEKEIGSKCFDFF